MKVKNNRKAVNRSRVPSTAGKMTKQSKIDLKGLGHAILGNFSTDQIVLELPKISK